MKTNTSGSLNDLLRFFPVMEPPLTLSGEVIASISAKNPALPEKLIAEYFSKWEEFDEYTEIIPCFRLEKDYKFHALVYWKGGLMSYEYTLISLSKEGTPIAKKVIAGTLSNNQTIKESVAHIQADHSIYTVVGESSVDSSNYQALNSSSFHFGLQEDGGIESIIEEELSTWEESEERKN